MKKTSKNTPPPTDPKEGLRVRDPAPPYEGSSGPPVRGSWDPSGGGGAVKKLTPQGGVTPPR